MEPLGKKSPFHFEPNIRPFWMNLGWYSGDPFKMFGFTFGEFDDWEKEKIDFLTIFSIQITRLTFAFGWCKYRT